jgi:FAD/FMN-containing dehydrogenase
MDAVALYRRRRESLVEQLAAATAQKATVALGKSTSNLFRKRDQRGARKLDVRGFNHVLAIDVKARVATVEGMTTYEALVDATLADALLPAVVPQLKTITIGGAVSGLGIESSSFRYGLVHESVRQMEVLLADGRVITCSREENADLFYGLPNSYGTLGYVLRLTIDLIPVRRYVRLTHSRYRYPEDLFSAVAHIDGDFADGTVFGAEAMFLTRAEMVDSAPRPSNYKWLNMYYQSIATREVDYLSIRDYIWRWDTDWFWCSKQFGLHRRVLRFCATPWLLNSRTYQRIMRLSQRVLSEGVATESVIQDVDIPIARAPDFLRFLLAEVGITPIWICPFRAIDSWPLYELKPGLYINFGFWDVVPTSHEPGHFNRKIEAKVLAFGGKKGLYSSVWYDEDTFWQIYNGGCYDELKRKYDPEGFFSDLYVKCVARQ